MKTQVATTDPGHLPGGEPDPDLIAALAHDMAPLRPSRIEAFELNQQARDAGLQVHWSQMGTSVGSPAELLLELAGVKAAIRTWFDKQPDQVIREASAYSARLTEVWGELRLLEASGSREYTQLRTMQVTPVLEEIDRQFKFAQSRITMQRLDVEMITRGGGGA
jgi:hypothetical protein